MSKLSRWAEKHLGIGGHHPPPVNIPLGPGSTGPGTGAMALPNTGQQTLGSTQPVYPNFNIPGDDTSGGSFDLSSIVSKLPGWVVDGLKIGLPAALQWLKDNKDSLVQGAALADAAYRQVQADKYASAAVKSAQSAYDAKAPLRSAGIQGMLQAGAANPFAKGALPLASNPGTPTQVTPLGTPNPILPGGIPWHTGVLPGTPTPPTVRDPRRVSGIPLAPGV